VFLLEGIPIVCKMVLFYSSTSPPNYFLELLRTDTRTIPKRAPDSFGFQSRYIYIDKIGIRTADSRALAAIERLRRIIAAYIFCKSLFGSAQLDERLGFFNPSHKTKEE